MMSRRTTDPSCQRLYSYCIDHEVSTTLLRSFTNFVRVHFHASISIGSASVKEEHIIGLALVYYLDLIFIHFVNVNVDGCATTSSRSYHVGLFWDHNSLHMVLCKQDSWTLLLLLRLISTDYQTCTRITPVHHLTRALEYWSARAF